MSQEKVLIVCDRGMLDNKSYMTDEGFQIALKELGFSEIELRDNYDAVFHGVPVFKNGEFIRREIENYLDQSCSFNLHVDYHFGGYAKTKPELLKFVQDFIATTGIIIEPVYTGKMLFAIFNLIENNYFIPGTRIIGIHTGGIFGLLGTFGFPHKPRALRYLLQA
jgi:hypothetical protein